MVRTHKETEKPPSNIATLSACICNGGVKDIYSTCIAGVEYSSSLDCDFLIYCKTVLSLAHDTTNRPCRSK